MKTVLIIEDEKEVCENIKFVLEREYKVHTSFSGKGGLDILKKDPVSLVVLDYMLPDIDGIEVLKEIKENYKIQVIMITAYGNKEVVLKSWRYQADYYFDKPFKLRELKEKVEELLESPDDAFPFNVLGFNSSQLSPDVLRALKLIGKNFLNPKGFSPKMIFKEYQELPRLLPCTFHDSLKRSAVKASVRP